ncbi:exodeoxyribonuclease V subunit gamma [Uruburuella testudinis]|uniref:RecBCD enzyme subunit RecC n=1 Tax=Uruburuella testudinis TaxID=1282863 RepID=A0ABY4DVZ8_9NEIS|nr:exodeoxyribonuclease V subunit gamma [Uruburuella testudinis]UOO83207.1 exodeoxyribonuclease V subunit gamma [Uruburuella testudinis]
MLYLHQSDRLENLARVFAGLQQLMPLENPLAPEEIVVQSQGMRRYLNTYLARELGVAANLKFSLPAGLTWRLMRECLPGIPELSPFAPEVMRWRLLGLFQSEAFQTASEYRTAHTALQSYLNSSESAAYQLSGQLADIFDQYLVYRPQWITAWQQGQLIGLGDDEIWQAALWRFLDDGSGHALHRVAMWQQLLDALSADKLPERLFVFGIATLAPMYLQLLQAVAEHCDVHIFALNPSSEYWGNVIEAAQILNSSDDIDLSQSGHPLLASLGKQGRDFFDALAEAPITEEHSYFSEPLQTASLLKRLQHDIQTLSLPDAAQSALLHDGSIRIHAAHSPLRELQILKDQLLAILAEHPDWQPHDIAVLTPNIEPYSPYIEAVFGQAQGGAQALPYSVSDVKLSRRQPLLYALEQTLELLESRFEVDRLLPLLDSDLVLARFELSREDLPLLHDTIAALNIHWGLDGDMRRRHGAANTLFTWQQGLERLVLGWLLPESSNPVWQNLSAWHSDPNQIAVFSRFSALIRTLAELYHSWQQPADISAWCERVRKLLAALFLPGTDDQHALQQIEQALARWQAEAELAAFAGNLPQHTAIRHLQHFLSSQSQAGFLRGGITFCSMVPMRSLPFKVICLLGLNDGNFPRNTKAAAFDLIARHPQKGDRARRDDDRYLFLEAIISAREILYLSYVGRSISNDDELAPSALLSELIDTLAAMSGQRSSILAADLVQQHPLQAFSHRYFAPSARSDGLISSRSDYAAALNRPAAAGSTFFHAPLTEAAATAAIRQEDFIRFWRNPVRSWLQHTLSWREPYTDEAWDAAEPFAPLHNGRITEAYTRARRLNHDFTRTAQRLNAESLLPEGELGRLWQQQFQTAAKSLDSQLLHSPAQPPYAYTLTLGGHTLHGSLSQRHRHGLIYFLNEKPSAPEELAYQLQHLIFCAVRPPETDAYHSHLLLPGHTETLPAIPQASARAQLQQWLAYFHLGQTRPLPFFARTSSATAKALLDNPADKRENAQQKARNEYRGNKKSTGQRDYTEVKLVFGRDEHEPIDTPLFWNLVEDLLLPLLHSLHTDNTGQPQTDHAPTHNKV